MQDSHLHTHKHEIKVCKQVRFLLTGMSEERQTPSVSLKKDVSCRSCLDPHYKCHPSTGGHAFSKSHRPSACTLRDRTNLVGFPAGSGAKTLSSHCRGTGFNSGQGMRSTTKSLYAARKTCMPQLTPSTAKQT